MSSKTDGNIQPDIENDDMAWNNDWDDNDSTGALESQQILHSRGDVDEDEIEIEDEIRANLSSKITSSLHAYKIAGLALIITLVSFTINTVHSQVATTSILITGICTIYARAAELGKTILYAVAACFKRVH